MSAQDTDARLSGNLDIGFGDFYSTEREEVAIDLFWWGRYHVIYLRSARAIVR